MFACKALALHTRVNIFMFTTKQKKKQLATLIKIITGAGSQNFIAVVGFANLTSPVEIR